MAPDRRNLILDAAIGVIARTGVRGLRVEVVAAEAGVAVSLIYYYFGSRKGLVRATWITPTSAPPGGALGRAGDAAGRAGRVRARDLDGLGRDPGERDLRPALREQVREATETWISVVAAAIASESSVPDPRAVAERLTALVDGSRRAGSRARCRGSTRFELLSRRSRRDCRGVTAGSSRARPPRAPPRRGRSAPDPRRPAPGQHRTPRRPQPLQHLETRGESVISDTRASVGSAERVANPPRSRSSAAA